MNRIHGIVFLLSLVLITSCNSPLPLDQQIIGEWTMHKVYDAGQDVTSQHNPENDRWVTFNKDGTFESGGTPFGSNAGRWKVENAVLSIDSDLEGDDSEWNISIENDEIIWTGIGDPRKEGFKVIHKRK